MAEQKKFTNKMMSDADYKELSLNLNIKHEVKDVKNDDTDKAFKALRPNTNQNIDEYLGENYTRSSKLRTNISN